jgi:hypothetical protein
MQGKPQRADAADGVDKMSCLPPGRVFGGKDSFLPKQIRALARFQGRFCPFIVAKIIPSQAWCIAIS